MKFIYPDIKNHYARSLQDSRQEGFRVFSCISSGHPSHKSHRIKSNIMKFISISFSLLLATTTAATSINDFDEQVQQVQLRGTPGTKRGKEWLSANQAYINGSLDWDKTLKQKATAYAEQGANNNCQLPTITNQGMIGYQGWGALASPDTIFQSWESDPKINVKTLANTKKVGCGDAKGSNGIMDCWVSACFFSN